MAISDHELQFDFHIQQSRLDASLPIDDAPSKSILRSAEYSQVCSVIDAVRDLHMHAVSLSGGFIGTEIDVQLRLGLGRRTKFLWLSLRELLTQIDPARDTPLSIEITESASKALNEIYINIRGSLDNLAYSLLELSDKTKVAPRRLSNVNVDLFGEKFLKEINSLGLEDFLRSFLIWNNELKDRRNPAAHRLPLFVLPSYQDSETLERYNLTLAAYSEANAKVLLELANGNYCHELIDDVDALRENLESIGRFHPMFSYDEKVGFMKIYPTVPEDVGQLVLIARGILRYISTHLRPVG